MKYRIAGQEKLLVLGSCPEAVARAWHAHQLPGWVPAHAADVLNSLEKDVFPYIGSTLTTAVTSPLVWRIEDRPSVETARRVRFA